MIKVAFLTLFLGLTLSQQKVELTVTGAPQRVEILLDDKVVAVRTHEPWSATVDFGDHLLPRRIIARALDSQGNELARAEQRVNVPRASAETQIVLERDDSGIPLFARLLWQSLEGGKPKRVEVHLDGQSILVDNNLRAKLPPIDNSRPHLLRAHMLSQLGVTSDAEIAFGGGLEDATSAELTAIVVRSRAPSITARGAPATIVGMEEIPGEVLVVRHPIETETSMRLDPSRRVVRRRDPAMVDSYIPPGFHMLSFLWPTANRTGAADLFPRSRPFGFNSAQRFKNILTDIGYPGLPQQLRFADAAAVAGLRALADSRPRAVLIILGENLSDASRLQPAQVREYLAAAGIPLYVWSLRGASIEQWGDVQDVSTQHGFTSAYERLARDLESQRIVWLRGDFLPQEIHIVDGTPAGWSAGVSPAAAARLARTLSRRARRPATAAGTAALHRR